MSYIRLNLVLHQADSPKKLKAYLPSEGTRELAEKLKASNKVLSEMIEAKQKALYYMKLASEANIRALGYLNYAKDYAQFLTNKDSIWLRIQILAKNKATVRYGLAARYTLLTYRLTEGGIRGESEGNSGWLKITAKVEPTKNCTNNTNVHFNLVHAVYEIIQW
jgi:hypothetical protein